MRSLVLIGALAGGLMMGGEALAEIYKYKKPNGQVVYTDNIGQLPPERRQYYDRLKAEQEAKRREQEQAIGKEELERREAEAAKANLERAQMEERERQERMRAIDLQLQSMQKKRTEREKGREAWRKRMLDAQALLAKKLEEFKATTTRHDEIAIKPSYSFLPGEAEELDKLKKQLEQLEKDVDAAIEQVEIIIPEEARRAGIPPGYLR